MESIIGKALNDAFVAGKSKQSFADFKKEWMSLNTIQPKEHSFNIDTLIKKLQVNKSRGFKNVLLMKDEMEGAYLLLEKDEHEECP